MKPRQLISDGQVAVVLDTSPIRNLAYAADPPDWVGTFIEMMRDGYSFSLADSTAAELLTQVRAQRIPEHGYSNMLSWICRFLNPDLPVLPGQVDVDAMVGLVDIPGLLDEARFISHEAWRQLLDPHASSISNGPPLHEILDEERDEWKSWLGAAAKHAMLMGIDTAMSDPNAVAEMLADSLAESLYAAEIQPPLSIRMHLEIRYRLRQMARSAHARRQYNPESRRNRNDGIDAHLYRYLILPAFVLAEDGGFFQSLEGIVSFQREWFMTPKDLAERWLAGERPRPDWPPIISDAE